MTDRIHESGSRDFAFHASDHAGGALQQQHARPPYSHYDDDHNAHGHDGPDLSLHTPVHDPSLTYHPDFNAQHQQLQGQFPGYGYAPSTTQMGWDWANSIDFSQFTQHYEPQGELVQELQDHIPTNDFSVPLPAGHIEAVYQAPQQPQQPQITPPVSMSMQNPLSPPIQPPQRPVVQTGTKRKADSELDSAVSGSAEPQQHQPKRQNQSRQPSETSLTSSVTAVTVEARQSPASQMAGTPAPPEPAAKANTEGEKKKEQSKGTGPQGRVIDVSKPRKVVESAGGDMLPAGKVFPIQIGSELFRLSGASLSSDAPSYFSHFFVDQLHNNGGRAGDVRTLYIDRDPDTFRDIALHLQGYHVTPKDGEHFVKLFADAQFYSLPRLTKQLFSTDIFIRIGGTPFQIPRDLFSAPGDSPNYFSLGFAQFFSTPSDSFPGLDRSSLLRPPSISPPSAPSKSGEIFGELIKILQGYNIEIRNDEHRSQLLRDARYFHLKGLEQRLIPCEISFNLKRQQSEILLRLDDIRQSGVSFSQDKSESETKTPSGTHSQRGLSPIASKAPSPVPSTTSSSAASRAGYVSYARPYTDDHAHTNVLILEVSARETTILYFPPSAPQASSSSAPCLSLRATFHKSTLARITSLFSVIASKMGLPATQPLGLMYLQTGSGVAAQPVSPANSGVSERRVRIRIDADCALEVDGVSAELSVDEVSGRVGIRRRHEWLWGGGKAHHETMLRANGEEVESEWVVKRAQWRLRVEPVEYDGEERRMQVVLCGVKIEALTGERSRNVERRFLGSA